MFYFLFAECTPSFCLIISDIQFIILASLWEIRKQLTFCSLFLGDCYLHSLKILSFFKDVIYLFLERGERREKERERNINVRLFIVHPLLGTWPATQACALSGNWTSNPLVCSLVLNPLSHTSQGTFPQNS